MNNVINSFLLIPCVMILMTAVVINHNLMNGIVSGKYFWFYSWLGIASLTLPLYYIINKPRVRLSRKDLIFLLLSIIGIGSSYFNTGMNTKTILFILIVILYFYYRIIFTTHSFNKNIFICFLLLTGIIEGVWGIRQLYGFSCTYNLFLLTGSFFNSGPYSGYLATIAPIALYYILYDYKIVKQKFKLKDFFYYSRWLLSLFTFILILSILPSTMSRASWISFFIGCTIITSLFLWHKYDLKSLIWKYQKYLQIGVLLILVVGIISGFQIYQLKKDSADGRLLIWKVSTKSILHYPFGVGIGNFPGTYANAQASYFSSGKATEQEKFVAGNPEYAFNEYLQMCIEMGIIPLLLFVTGIIMALYSAYKNKGYPEFAALISLLIFAGMSYPFNCLPFLVILVLLLALCVTKNSKNPTKKTDTPSTIFLFIGLMGINSIAIISIYKSYPTYEAYKDWKYAKKLSDMGYYFDSKDEYEKLFSLLKDQSYFLFEYGYILSRLEEYEKSNEILGVGTKISSDPMFHNIIGKNYQALQDYKKAEECFIKSSSIIPNRHYPLYLLAKLYQESGEIIKAKQMGQRGIDKKPKIPSGAIEDMKKEMREIIEGKQEF